MKSILQSTRENPTEAKMLNYVVNNRKEKSVKKAFYKAYETSLNHIGHYYPYSDYIFSRTIKNIDLLIKLIGINPTIKLHLFTDETFSVGIKSLLFLKKHYTKIQIVNFFIDIQNKQEHKNRLLNWQNTLRMFQRMDAFNLLNEHFIKVKLTAKNLHDEIEKILPVVFHILDNKENFEYDKVYLSACCTYEELEFKLPSTVKELSLWEKELRSNILGDKYVRNIHQKKYIIYGVFKQKKLLYILMINNFEIEIAKGVLNSSIPQKDMEIINSWKNNRLLINRHKIVKLDEILG